MNKIWSPVFIVLSFAVPVMMQYATAQTQTELSEQTCATSQEADKELDQVYQQVMKASESEKRFTAALKKAQQAWVSFRDLHLASLYPAENKQMEYGSIYPMCYCLEKTRLTRERIAQLRQWLEGMPEGDPCSGSRRVMQK